MDLVEKYKNKMLKSEPRSSKTAIASVQCYLLHEEGGGTNYYQIPIITREDEGHSKEVLEAKSKQAINNALEDVEIKGLKMEDVTEWEFIPQGFYKL
jgi:dolichyl-phosphate-mannose--protein O-mannosyl transferase